MEWATGSAPILDEDRAANSPAEPEVGTQRHARHGTDAGRHGQLHRGWCDLQYLLRLRWETKARYRMLPMDTVGASAANRGLSMDGKGVPHLLRARVPSLCYEGSPPDVIGRSVASGSGLPHFPMIKREVRMTKSLVWSVAILAALALGACAGEDPQTTERGIDQDITVSHQPGRAALDNVRQNGFAPWHF